MPNFVKHRMAVARGDPEALARFIKDTHGTPFFDFNALIPMPEPTDSVCGTGGEWDWAQPCDYYAAIDVHEWHRHQWRTAHWGTKWNSTLGHFDDLADGYLEFSTAWSVPEPIFKKLAALLPDHRIAIRSDDEGDGFTAKTWIENGESTTVYFDDPSCSKKIVNGGVQT